MENLRLKGRKVIGLAPRQLPRMVREYPREPLLGAIAGAAQYRLYDLDLWSARIPSALRNVV